MGNSENILNEIKEMAPALSSMKKDHPFHASDQYFDELTSKIQQKILKDKHENKTFHLFTYLQKPQFAIAASLLIILCISAFYFHHYTSNQAMAQSNTIYWDEILNENSTVVDKIDEALLVEVLTNETTIQNKSKKDNMNQPMQKAIDEVSDEVESAYSNDIFNEL